MKIQTKVAGISLEHPLMNAAGTCKLLEDAEKLARSASAAIVVGSITVEPRAGNSGNVYHTEPMFSLNSLGLPNPGAQYYKKIIPEMAAIAHRAGKPLFVSVAGFTPEEYANLADLAFSGGADLVELNLGCPNIWHKEMQKRIVCFDPILVAEVLRQVEIKVGPDAKVSAKFSPFSDPFALAELAKTIAAFQAVKAVTAVNTFPNAFSYTGKYPSISPSNGLAGLAGPAMKPIGLGQVKQLRALLPEHIQIIGVGGVTHGRDIWEYRQNGASAVQTATTYLNRHEKVFSSLIDEFLETIEA